MTPAIALSRLSNLTDVPFNPPALSAWEDALKTHPWQIKDQKTREDYARRLEHVVEMRHVTRGSRTWTKHGLTADVLTRMGELVRLNGYETVTAELDRLIKIKMEHDEWCKAIYNAAQDKLPCLKKLCLADLELCRILMAGHLLWRYFDDNTSDRRQFYLNAVKKTESWSADSAAVDHVMDYFIFSSQVTGTLNISGDLSTIMRQFVERRFIDYEFWPVTGWKMAAELFGSATKVSNFAI